MKSFIHSFFTLLLLIAFTGYLKATDVLFNVVVPVLTRECWIVGNFNGWNPADAKKCTSIDPTHYRIMLNNSTWKDSITISNLKYQYLSQNCDWTYVERGKDGNYVAERTYKAGVNDTVANWAAEIYESIIPIRVTTPKGTKHCFIYGDLFGQEISVGSYELYDTLLNSDSTVVFFAFIPSVSRCSNNILSFRFSSGPTLDYDQLIPSDSFGASDLNPVVYAWKSIYSSVPQLSTNKVKIYSTSSEIIIEGTEKNDIVTIQNIVGQTIKCFKSNAEPIVFKAQKHEIYFVTTPLKSVKITLN